MVALEAVALDRYPHMAFSVATRVGRVGFLASTAAMGSVAIASAAAAQDDESSLIADAPSQSFVLIDGGDLNGPIDGGTMMELTGTPADMVPNEMRRDPGRGADVER